MNAIYQIKILTIYCSLTAVFLVATPVQISGSNNRNLLAGEGSCWNEVYRLNLLTPGRFTMVAERNMLERRF